MKGFIEEYAAGQRWLRMSPPGGKLVADIRFFMRGPLLDGTGGRAVPLRRNLTPLLGECQALIAPKQVHGVTVLDSTEENINIRNINITEETVMPSIIEADGILLDSPGIEASLRFADCAPVVVAPFAVMGASWVLMMHSGFKGTVRNIVKAGTEKLRERFGTEALRAACAWIGPCIGGANYPRDREEWTERGLAAFRKENIRTDGDKVFFDLAGELKLQLKEAGIAESRVFLSGIDTFECRGRCYSYRGGEAENRMFLWSRLHATKSPESGILL